MAIWASRAVDEAPRLSVQEVEAFVYCDEKSTTPWSNDVVLTNPLNILADTRPVLRMLSSGFLVMTAYGTQTEFARLYRDDTFILAGSETIVWGGRTQRGGGTEHLRFTAIWMREGGERREVAHHGNIIHQP